MLDQYLRKIINPFCDLVGKKLSSLGVSANIMTVLGFVLGLAAMFMVYMGYYYAALFFFCGNRFADGIDGAIARDTNLTDFGGFLDIVCDFIIYSGMVFAFGFSNIANTYYALFLIFSFIGPITSFLAYAIIASKRSVITEKRGRKSFYYLGGLCEGTETALVLVFFCLVPGFFNIGCVIFGIMCWITTGGRVYSAWNDFYNEKSLSSAYSSDIYKS